MVRTLEFEGSGSFYKHSNHRDILTNTVRNTITLVSRPIIHL